MSAIFRTRTSGFSSIAAGGWAVALFSVVLLLTYQETVWSMVAIWIRSETFAHGFLILPISLWLIWSKREELGALAPEPIPGLALLLIVPGCAWILGSLVDVLVVQQLALVCMLVLGVWAILGHRLCSALIFPLLFLFLAVPMGETLVAPMMEFTATSTVWLVQQTGIPVYREGMYFTLPSGSWSVVEACSGVRYIIASFTLGLLYSYLTYRTLWRRLVFVLISLVVPVIANTIRAYMIVMLGHWSDMTIATGVDHLVYGWIFFGVVMFLLFWAGSMFREDHESSPTSESIPAVSRVVPDANSSRLAAAVLVALAIPAVVFLLSRTASLGAGFVSPMPQFALAPYLERTVSADEVPWQWRPDTMVTVQSDSYFSIGDQIVGLYVQHQGGSETDGDVVGSSKRFTHPDAVARVLGRDRIEVQFSGKSIQVDQAEVREPGGQLLAWSWYRIGSVDTSSDYVAKIAQAWRRLETGTDASHRIVIAVPMDESVPAAQAVLQVFLDEYGAELDSALGRAVAGDGQ